VRRATAQFLIVEGVCRVVQETAQGTRELRKMGAGEVFGELALVLGGARSATVIAEQDVEVIVIGRDAFETNDIQAGWSGALLRALAERFRAVEADRNLQGERNS
jgi:CRP-like cAMP-binding protein